MVGSYLRRSPYKSIEGGSTGMETTTEDGSKSRLLRVVLFLDTAGNINVLVGGVCASVDGSTGGYTGAQRTPDRSGRSEEHTSELQSLMRISYAVFCLKKKKTNTKSSLIK